MAAADGSEPPPIDPAGRAEVWSDPIPPPAVLEGFERALPGLAREIVDEFRAEAKHRREIEVRASRTEAASELLGKAMALLFAGGCFGVTVYAVAHDADWVAGVIGGGTIVSGIAAFLSRSRPE